MDSKRTIQPYQIGIDLGGTKLEIVLFDPDLKLIYRHRVPTPQDVPLAYECLLFQIETLIGQARHLIPPGMDYHIGIGIPGTIDKKCKTVYKTPNISYLSNRPLWEDIEKRIDHPIKMTNDANCFALAESLYGAAKGYNVVFGIILGTGCGAGLCINGQIYEGNNGIAGEWGHFSIDPYGLPCHCGKVGCIETHISGKGVEKKYFRRFHQKKSMPDILFGCDNHDPLCLDIFNQFIDDFGRCVGGLISILDPDAVVIGGGLSNIPQLYTVGAEKIKKYAFNHMINTPILKNKLGDAAGVFGAAWIH